MGQRMDKQRYEREIEEILSKYDQESGRRSGQQNNPPREDWQSSGFRPNSSPPTRKASFSMPDWKRLSAGQYMLAAFGVAIVAVVVRGVPVLSSVLVILAAVLFLVPVLLYYTSGATKGGWSSRDEKRWRGQVIDFNTRRNITNDSDPLASIKRWFKNRR